MGISRLRNRRKATSGLLRVAFRAGWNLVGVSGPQLINHYIFFLFAIFHVPPPPQAISLCQKELLFVLAILEVWIAVVAIVKHACRSLTDVRAGIHRDRGIESINRRSHRARLIWAARREILESCIVHANFGTGASSARQRALIGRSWKNRLKVELSFHSNSVERI